MRDIRCRAGIVIALASSISSTGAQRADLPRFDRVLLLEHTSETSANVHIGDVNGDGKLDIVLAKGRHWPLVDRVLLGDGRGAFPTAYDLGPASDRTYSGNLVDLDGDGDLDVVISNDTPDPKRIYLNDGGGRFRQSDTYGRAEWSTRNAAIADMNGDRLPDIIVANRTLPAEAANYICLNRGKGAFDDDCVAFSRESATTIAPADVNGDGRIDLVVPHRDGGQSHVYMNQSSGDALRFTRVAFGPADATIRVSAAVDLDRDGRIDIVAIDEKRGVFVFFGERPDAFSAGVPVGDRRRTPYALTVADLNRDGAIDVVVGHVEAASTVFFNDGSGRAFTPVDFGDGKGTVYGFDVGDVDNDGRLDLAAARSEAPNVVFFAGSGTATQEARVQGATNLQDAIQKIDALTATEFAKDKAASVTVGVVSGAQLAWTKSYGLADMERNIPATRDSVYRIGSITKQFTALMLLQLVQEGKVRLSDPVEKYFPDINKVQGRHAGAPPITLGQLATMTSGLAREPANLSTYLVGPVKQWEHVLMSALPQTKYDFEPDAQYFYSNIGYAILGAAIGRAAGTTYTTWVHERIFAPLGMTHTAFEPNATIQSRIAKGYEVDRDGKISFEAPLREHAGRGYKVPNGAIYTTVDDLARFVALELGEGPDTVIGRKLLEANFARANSANGDLTSAYGVGFQLTRRGANVFAGHGGSVAGYTAQAWVHRPSKTGVIVLRNAGGGSFNLSGLTFAALEELAKSRAATSSTPR